jgi:hypothetical protein
MESDTDESGSDFKAPVLRWGVTAHGGGDEPDPLSGLEVRI